MRVIADATLGPNTDCRDYIWQTLTGFSSWTESLNRLQSLELYDADPTGRGTRLLLQWRRREEEWVINYWHPGQRLELVRQLPMYCTGIRFDLNAGPDPGQIRLILEVEIKCYGLLGIISPICSWLLTRRLKAQFLPILRTLESGIAG